MKSFILCITLALLAALPAAAQQDADALEGRPRIPLEGAWEMQMVRQLDDAPEGDWGRMQLPGRRTLPRDNVPEPGRRNEPGPQRPDDESQRRRGLWVRRSVEVPADWRDGRIVLRVGKVVFTATAWVNGQRAGDIPGYGAELDITDLVTFGEANEIRLFFGEYGEGVEHIDSVTRATLRGLTQQAARGGWDWGSRYVGVLCEPEHFYIEAQNPDIAITDVWYRTYTRGYPRIIPQVTVRARRPFDGVTARLIVAERGGAVVRDETFPVGRLDVGDRTLDLPVRADDLKLWGIHQPNLYVGQIVLLDAGGEPLDRSAPTTFGIREFYTRGKDWYLNGQQVHFVFSWAGQNRQTIQEKVDQGVTLMASNIARPGSYITRVHVEVPPVQHKISDELGVALTYLAGENRWLDMTDPEIVRDYTTWVREHLRRVRNHPSILFWCIGMNTPGNYLDFSPTTIGRLSNIDDTNVPAVLAMVTHNEIDPTRLTYFHGGPAGGDVATGNIYFNHMPTQEVEDWLSQWAERGDRPAIAVEFLGAPLGVDFLTGAYGHDATRRRSFITEYAARLAGDRAYTVETAEQRAYEHNVVPRGGSYWNFRPHHYNTMIIDQIIQGHRLASRSWRFEGVPQYTWGWSFWGTSGMQPRIDQAPEHMRDHVRRIMQMDLDLLKPVKLWIGGPVGQRTAKDHAFYGGETVEKTLVAIHDRVERSRWRMQWRVTPEGGGEAIAEGAHEYVATPFARLTEPLRFTAPEVADKTGFVLTMDVTDLDTGEAVGADSFRMTVWPRRERLAGPATPFHIIDPEGDTARWLRELGVTVAPVERATDETRVLIIGRRGLRPFEDTLPFTPEQVAAGLRVVIFEQHCDDLGKFGFRHEDRSPRHAFVRQSGHPLTAGLTDDDLANWRGAATLIPHGPEGDRVPLTRRLYRWGNRGVVTSNIIETPHYGPFETLIECEFDLAYTPLMRWPHGRGEVIFCQLDLVGRIGLEPAADRVAHNLIGYLGSELALPQGGQSREAVCYDRQTFEALEALGFRAAMHDDLDNRPALINPLRVFSGADPQAFARQRDAVAFGGDALVLYATERLLADPFFEGVLSVERRTTDRGGREAPDHPLLKGVGPQLLRWREPLSFNVLSSDNPDVTILLDGLAAVYQKGDTRIVFLQADPAALEDFGAAEATDAEAAADQGHIDRTWRRFNRRQSHWRLNRLHTALLGNLGVQSHPALVKRLVESHREIPMTPVNEWVYLGPIPTDPDNPDPLSTDFVPWLEHRNLMWKGENRRGEEVSWSVPTDSQNGMGMGGRMDLSRVYGVRPRDAALAVTQLWSSRPRVATVKYGGDWWARLIVNGEAVAGGGAGFERQGAVPLKAGWNDVVVVIAAGSNGHWFQFHITNPGDLAVAQRLAAPPEGPRGLPPVDRLLPEEFDPGFSFYTEPMQEEDDPYKFIPW